MTKLPSLLSRLEEVWLRKGMPHVDWLAPGLDPEQTRRIFAANGLHAPAEIVEWFAWHNGTAGKTDELRPLLGPSGFEPLSIEANLAQRAMMIDIAKHEEESEDVPEEDLPLWDPSWIPVACDVGGTLLTAEVSSPDRDTAPIRTIDWEDVDYKAVKASSLAEVVEFWLDLLDSHCEWSPTLGDWDYDYAALPLDVRQRDLL